MRCQFFYTPPISKHSNILSESRTHLTAVLSSSKIFQAYGTSMAVFGGLLVGQTQTRTGEPRGPRGKANRWREKSKTNLGLALEPSIWARCIHTSHRHHRTPAASRTSLIAPNSYSRYLSVGVLYVGPLFIELPLTLTSRLADS